MNSATPPYRNIHRFFVSILVLLLFVVVAACGRSSNRILTGPSDLSGGGSSLERDTTPAVTSTLPPTNVQPNVFPVVFKNLSGEPITIYYTTDGSEPDFFSDFVSPSKMLGPDANDAPALCKTQTKYAEVCITQDTNIKWFSIDANNNIEETQSAVYRVRDAQLALELLSQSASLNQGYEIGNNPPPVIVEYRVLFSGRLKFCLGAPDTSIPGSPDDTYAAETANLDINTIIDLYQSTKDSATPANLDDITCGSGDFADLVDVPTREGETGATFSALGEKILATTDVLDIQSMQIPMQFLRSDANAGSYRNRLYMLYEVIGTDGSVQGLTGKEIQVVTDIFKPLISATLDSGTYGNYRYVYLYSNDVGNQIYYRINGAGSTVTKSDILYSVSNPILIEDSMTLRFTAFDPAGNSAINETKTYTLNLNAPAVALQRDSGGMVAAPDYEPSTGQYVRYTNSQIGGSNRLNFETTGNEEVATAIYLRAGNGTIEDALLAERDSADTGIYDISHKPGVLTVGGDFDPNAECFDRACLILLPAAETDRAIDLDVSVFTKLQYVVLSAYGDLNPGLATDPGAMQNIDGHPSESTNPDDDGTNAAFATSETEFLANNQKIEETKTITVYKTGGNYDPATEVFTGLDGRGKLFLEIKSIKQADDPDVVYMHPGDLPMDPVTLSNANIDPVTKRIRIDFDDLPEGEYPVEEEKLIVTYKYLEAINKTYYVYGTGSDPNDAIQSEYRSLTYQTVDQKITATLTKSNLKNLPDKYLDINHPNFVPIRVMDIDTDQLVNPAPGHTCHNKGWGMLECNLQLMNAGEWNCDNGNPRNLANGSWALDPGAIPDSEMGNICPGEDNAERGRVALQYLMLLNSYNADVTGTPLEDMIEISNWIIDNIGSNYETGAHQFAALMELELDEPFLDAEIVKYSVQRNLLRSHPRINDDDGTIPFLLSDAITDLATFKPRFDWNNMGTRTLGDNFMGDGEVARKDSNFAPDGTGWRGFVYTDIPPTEVIYDNEEDGHLAFEMALPSRVKGEVQDGLSFAVNTTTGVAGVDRLVRNPLNVNHLSLYPDPGTADTNGDGLRDCGPYSYFDGGVGCESDNSDPDDLKTGGSNTVDQNSVGMVIQGLNDNVEMTLPFGMGGIQDNEEAQLGWERNHSYGTMHPWTQGGIPDRNWNTSGNYDTLFDAPHRPTNYSHPFGSVMMPNSFPDSCWEARAILGIPTQDPVCGTHAEPEPYNRPYRLEHIIHMGAWAQYHHIGYKHEVFEAIIDFGWFQIPIKMADIYRNEDSWTELGMDAAFLMELIGFYIPDREFFLFETITLTAQRRLHDRLPSAGGNGDAIEISFNIPNVPIGITATQMKNSMMETFTSPSGLADMKGLAGDIFAVQNDAPEIYVNVFEAALGEDCAGGPSSGSVTCSEEDKVLVFNTQNYTAGDNVLWESSVHSVGQQCPAPDNEKFCGQKNWDIIAGAPASYFYRDYFDGSLTEPMNSSGSGTGKEKVIITTNQKLQIFDDSLNDYRDAAEYEKVEYYVRLQDNKNASLKYIFRLEFTKPQGGDDIGFTWSRVE